MTHFHGNNCNNLLTNMYSKFIIFFIIVLLIVVTTMAEHDHDISGDELAKIAGYGEDKLSIVLITGSLLCDYTLRKTQAIRTPVPGAEVGVSCQTSKKVSKLIWAKATTDEFGDFIIDLPSELHAIRKLDENCVVNILKLPGKYCGLCHYLTDNNNKNNKGKLTLSSVGNGIRTYAAQFLNSKSTPQMLANKENKHQSVYIYWSSEFAMSGLI